MSESVIRSVPAYDLSYDGALVKFIDGIKIKQGSPYKCHLLFILIHFQM